jgi:S-(hydroxymethyl)glutathione dehydrogenase/alcohol dehydrogenase
MRAAVLFEANQPLRIVDGLTPPALRRGQVQVRLAYAGVCRSQVMEARGLRGEDRHLPHLLGHEGSGVVESTGEGVTKVKPGDHVILTWIRSRGLEAAGTQYQCGPQALNAGAVTTFNTHAVVSENRCVPLPVGVPMDVAVLFGCALLTGAGIVTNQLEPPPGSTVAVFGVGGVGLSALMACRLYESPRLVAVDVSAEKLAVARACGATDVIDARSTDPVAEIRTLTQGVGVDFSIEAAGTARTIEQAFESVRRSGGVCVFASHPAHGRRISLDPYELICGKRIIGTWGGQCDPDRDIPRFADLYRRGELPLERLLEKRYRLDAINMALDDLERGAVLRPLIEIDASIG